MSKRCPDKVSGHTIGGMSGQGVRTHHRRAAERGLLTLVYVCSIRTTYPDKICYHPVCDVHECRIAWRCVSTWGIRMELSWIGPYTLHTQTVPLAIRDRHFHFLWISHPEFCPVKTCPDPLSGYFTSRRLKSRMGEENISTPLDRHIRIIL